MIDRETILQYAREQFGTEPEYLWAKYPNYCVLRRADDRKWYAAVMGVPGTKLGLSGDGVLDILNVKCGSVLLGSLLGEKGFMPAYHMNKSYWVTIMLDGSVPEDKIFQLLTISYDLTKKK